MNELSTADDSSLLADWADRQNQNAFAALVEKYQSLVFGAALRRAAQPEVARDVSQQVFSLVATRARLLIGHTNIAGWLYRAATHIAGRMQRSDLRRSERHEVLRPEPAAAEASHERWVPLEEALDSLGARDREAIVLHYFQDLSYPEMAGALGIEPDTARQRVCRALDRLGKKLRRSGYTGAVPALLASAAAWPSATGAVLPAAASLGAAGVGPSLVLTFSAIVSHSATKVAAMVIAGAALPWLFQSLTHAEPSAGFSRPASSSFVAAPTRPAAATFDQAAYDKLREARLQAERRAAELSLLARNADSEILDPLGTVEDLARKVARVARLMLAADLDGKPAPHTAEWEKRAASVLAAAEGMPQLMAAARHLNRIERDATKAGRFYATFIGEVLELDEPTRKRFDEHLQAWVLQMQRDGLALPQRPRENSGDWDVRRMEAMDAQMASLADLLPAELLRKKPELKALKFASGDGKKTGPAEATQTMSLIFGQNP